MFDEILHSPFLDKMLKFLDKQNLFYPVAKNLGTIATKFLWKLEKDDFNIYAIGQSHLDAAWLWRRIVTIRKNNVTFSNALKHMDEYPFFTFSCSSAQYYEWMENYFPEKFEKIKQRVKEGRLELVGGMWIEPDLNCTSGESLVRQRLYGQRYYLEKFGKMSEIGWLTDCFGYNWTLPQILRKSGAKFFYTNKMSWNKVSKFPFMVFHWQSPDGSQVLTLSMPYTINAIINSPGMGQFKEYTSVLENIENDRVFNYESDYEDIKERRTGDYIHDLPMIYGLGDGGGGPLRIEIIVLKDLLRQKSIQGFITMREYFSKIEKSIDLDRLPIWNDEMYLEVHRGCYTSQVWLKALMRKTEFAMYNLEILGIVASVFGGWGYPKEKLRKIWKLVLFNQFHDILPGSSIPEVYVDTREDFKKIQTAINIAQESATQSLLKQINIEQPGLLIFNTNSWKRDSPIEISDVEPSIIKSTKGIEIPSQISENKQLFIAKDIPSCGYTYVSLDPTENLPEYKTDLIAEDAEELITLENTFLKVQINKRTGTVSSIYHKTLKKQILTAPGNCVQIYEEMMLRENPAWNIDPSYNEKPVKLEEEIQVELKESGPVRVLVEVRRKVEKPSILIVQKISLLTNTNRVDFKLYLQYYIKKTIIKLAFPLDVETDKIHCEIPFGVIDRFTQPKTPAQKGQWEIPCHKWVDVSQSDYGVTLINKSRYGFDARYHPKYKNVVRMTVLRIPVYPSAGNPLMSLIPSGKYHEQSEFSVDYALYIHKGDWIDAQSYLPASEFNNPPIQIPVNKNTGALPEEFEFVKVEPTNVLVSAIKLPEDTQNKALVLRVYETIGKPTEADMKFHERISIESVAETDLLEMNPQEFLAEKDSVHFSIKPFEIKTFLIKYQISS